MYSAHVDFAASRSHQGAQLFSPLLQATQVAWQYLDPTTRKAIRATSRSGRLLHDSSLTHLAVRLGSCRDLRRWLEEAPLGATGLKSLLWDLQVRKARVSSLHISLRGFSSRRRSILEQLEAFASAASVFTLTSVTLDVEVLPLSHCTAAELAAISHVATRVSVDAPWHERTTIPGRNGLTRDGHRMAIERLLAQRMPQLRELELKLSDWPRGLRVLGSFPALTSLKLTLGPTGDKPTPDGEAEMVEQLAQLTHLRYLTLAVKPHGVWQHPLVDRLHAKGDCLYRLANLTALTRLELQLEAVCETWGDSYSKYQATDLLPPPDQEAKINLMYDTLGQRSSVLLSALHEMRSLLHLSCPGMWFTPFELTWLPPSLRHLEIEGLLPPKAEELDDKVEYYTPMPWDLPPQLLELRLLGYAASPKALAAIRPPPEVKGGATSCRVHCFQLRFGLHDIDFDTGCLHRNAVATVGPALELLCATRPRPGQWTLQVAADGAEWPMAPPEDQEGEQEGHVGWVRQLQAAGEACTGLVLHNMALRSGDLEALTTAMPQLKRLELCGTALPVPSLPLLAALRQLEELVVDVSDVTDEELRGAVDYLWEATAWGSALGALCAGAPALQRVAVVGVGWRADVRGVREQVAGWLTGTGREREVVLEVT